MLGTNLSKSKDPMFIDVPRWAMNLFCKKKTKVGKLTLPAVAMNVDNHLFVYRGKWSSKGPSHPVP